MISVESSLLPLASTPSKQPLRYVVRGTPLVLVSKTYDTASLSLVVLSAKNQEIPIETVGTFLTKPGSVEITLDQPCSGRSYFILQLKDGDRILYQECVKTINSHTAVQILRQEQKGSKGKSDLRKSPK